VTKEALCSFRGQINTASRRRVPLISPKPPNLSVWNVARIRALQKTHKGGSHVPATIIPTIRAGFLMSRRYRCDHHTIIAFAVRHRPQQTRMSNHETSSSSPTGMRRRAYRPAIVLFVISATVMIGVVLKTNARDQRTTTPVAEQITGENPGPAALK
jgi:hypothetical protein